MSGRTLTFGGRKFGALRPDQQEYVQHLMLSWRRTSYQWYDRKALPRAIKKALVNRP